MEIRATKPHAGQASMLKSARRYNCARMGRRFGKSELGLGIVQQFALEGWPVAWFSPTYKYFSEAWNELVDRLSPVIESRDKSAGTIRLTTGGVIDVWSLHNNPNAGRGRKYKIVVVDEAAIVANLMYVWQNAIRPTLTDLKGSAWFLSTPAGYNDFNEFYERGQSGDPEWQSWCMGTIDNPYISPEEIESARAELPTAVFEQEYLGIPAPDGGNPFGLEHINACAKEGLTVGSPPICWGIDLAKSQDWTVCIGLDESGNVARFERWQHVPWSETKSRIAGLIGQTPALVDATGLGDPIVESLERDHMCQGIEPFVFTNLSKQRIMEGLASSIQSGSVAYPEGDIARELRTFRYEFSTGGRVKYAAPQGLHDDCVCALAMAVESLRKIVPVRISVTKTGLAKSREPVAIDFNEARKDWNFGF